MKKIVVIGTGRMGGAFATAFVKRTSHAVSIRGSHAGSSSAAALSRQLGVQIADDKELLAADQALDRGVSAGGFPASLGATEKVAERQNHHRPQALRKGTHHETARQ